MGKNYICAYCAKCFPIPEFSLDNYFQWSTRNEWNNSVQLPIISVNIVREFLAYVHAFITHGFEAQAMTYSCRNDSVIKYLAHFPQVNNTKNVSDIPTSLSPLDAFKKFEEFGPSTNGIEFHQSYWISQSRLPSSLYDSY